MVRPITMKFWMLTHIGCPNLRNVQNLKLVAMETNFVKNGKLPTFFALTFRNVMGYCYLNVRLNSAKWRLYIVWIIREVWPSNSRVDRAYLWTSGATWPKNWRILSNITVWEHFGYKWWICTLFYDLARDVAMTTIFWKKMANSPIWHSGTHWRNALTPCICMI